MFLFFAVAFFFAVGYDNVLYFTPQCFFRFRSFRFSVFLPKRFYNPSNECASARRLSALYTRALEILSFIYTTYPYPRSRPCSRLSPSSSHSLRHRTWKALLTPSPTMKVTRRPRTLSSTTRPPRATARRSRTWFGVCERGLGTSGAAAAAVARPLAEV